MKNLVDYYTKTGDISNSQLRNKIRYGCEKLLGKKDGYDLYSSIWYRIKDNCYLWGNDRISRFDNIRFDLTDSHFYLFKINL